VWKKIQGWKDKLLSQAGREMLIKAVTQAIPVYAMSCFRIPDGICTSINSMSSNFWWEQRNNERKMHWKSWDGLCSLKSGGGMRFRNLRWCLVHGTESVILDSNPENCGSHGKKLCLVQRI
jgi:hypothetical protein